MANWYRRSARRPVVRDERDDDYDTFGETASASRPMTYDRAAVRPGSYIAANVVAVVAYILEAVLALRFIFLLAGANSANGFVSFIYDLSRPFANPFQSIFGTATPDAGIVNQSVFEPGTLIAMVVYGLVAVVLMRLFRGTSREV